MLKPEEIYNEQFELSVLGGYKREQVDSFFASVSSDYEKLYKENAELIQKLKVCVAKIDEYQKDEQFLKAAIINAEKLNNSSLRDLERREKEIAAAAKEKADSIIESAQLEAENVVKSAQLEADSIVKAARLEASESIKACEEETTLRIAELKNAQDAEEKCLNNLKKEVADFKDMILKLYKQHLNSLSKLPEYESKPKEIKKETVEPIEKPVVQQVEEPVPENKPETVPEQAPEQVDVDKEPINEEPAPVSEKTAEFVIEKATVPSKPKEDEFERNFKFKDLKFGTDFDIKKEK